MLRRLTVSMAAAMATLAAGAGAVEIHGDLQANVITSRTGREGSTLVRERLNLRAVENITEEIEAGISTSTVNMTGSAAAIRGDQTSMAPYIEANRRRENYRLQAGFTEAQGGSLNQPGLTRRSTYASLVLTPPRLPLLSVRWAENEDYDQLNRSNQDQEQSQFDLSLSHSFRGLSIGYTMSRRETDDRTSSDPVITRTTDSLRLGYNHDIGIVPALNLGVSYSMYQTRSREGSAETGNSVRNSTDFNLRYTPSSRFRAVENIALDRSANRIARTAVTDLARSTEIGWRPLDGINLNASHAFTESNLGDPTGSRNNTYRYSLNLTPWEPLRISASGANDRAWSKVDGGRSTNQRDEYGSDIFLRILPEWDMSLHGGRIKSPTSNGINIKNLNYSTNYRGFHNTDLSLSSSYSNIRGYRSRSYSFSSITYFMDRDFRVENRVDRSLDPPSLRLSSGMRWDHQNRLFVNLGLVYDDDPADIDIPLNIELHFHPVSRILARLEYSASDLADREPEVITLELDTTRSTRSNISFRYGYTFNHTGLDTESMSAVWRTWF